MTGATLFGTEPWMALASGACMLAAGTTGTAVAAWLLQAAARLTTDGTDPLVSEVAAELQARAAQRLRAVGATAWSVAALAASALVAAVIA